MLDVNPESLRSSADPSLTPRGAVISAATIKGGAGKSTLIACLATYWQRRGRTVALVDADPNQTLTRWHEKGNVLSQMTLQTKADEYSIVGIVNDLCRQHEFVLIDCAGFANQAMIFAVGTSDLVLIPVMADEANIFEAVRTKRLVDSAALMTQRRVITRAVLNRIRRTRVAGHSRTQLEQLNVTPMNTALSDRTIFQEASFHGSSPIALAPSSAAASEISSLGLEIEALW